MARGYTLKVPTKMVVSDAKEAEQLIIEELSRLYKINIEDWLQKTEDLSSEVVISLEKAMTTLMETTKNMQARGDKDPIKYILFYYLRSSYLDESFKLMIETQSKASYFDTQKVSVDWIPVTIKEYYLTSVKKLDEYILRNNIIYNKNDLEKIKAKHYIDYMLLLPRFLNVHLYRLLEMGLFNYVAVECEFMIAFTDYMGSPMPILSNMPVGEGE